MQFLRLAIAIALAGCVAFDPRPQQQDAAVTRDAAGDDAPETLSEAANRVITTWQRCITSADLELSQLGPTWATLLTELNKTCSDCHDGGGNSFVATQNTDFLLATLTAERSYLLQYLTVDLTTGPPGAKMIVNAAVQTAVSSGMAPHATHPRFDPDPGLEATESLRKIVQTRLEDGQCPD